MNVIIYYVKLTAMWTECFAVNSINDCVQYRFNALAMSTLLFVERVIDQSPPSCSDSHFRPRTYQKNCTYGTMDTGAINAAPPSSRSPSSNSIKSKTRNRDLDLTRSHCNESYTIKPPALLGHDTYISLLIRHGMPPFGKGQDTCEAAL